MRNLARELTCPHGRYHLSCPVCKEAARIAKLELALASLDAGVAPDLNSPGRPIGPATLSTVGS